MHALHSAQDVAALLGIEVDTLYRYVRAGKLSAVKIGKLWRFTEADVEDFVRRRRRDGSSAPGPLTLPGVLRDAARRHPSGGGVQCGATMLGFGDLDARSDRLARALVARGVEPGDRVVVALMNSAEFVIACFAVWKARAVLVPIDAAARPAALLHAVDETAPRVLVMERAVAEQLEGVRPFPRSVGAILVKDRTFALSGVDRVRVESLDAELERDDLDGVPLPGGAEPEDLASITYTSGSTGAPKGVMHAHASWLASAAFTRDHARIAAGDAIVIPLPLHHGLAFRQILAYTLAGGTVILAGDIYQALKLLRERRPTALVLVPAACNLLLDHFAPVLRDAGASLRYVEIGSAAIAPARLRRLRELLPGAEVRLPYGLTEARVGFLGAGRDGMLNRIETVAPGLELRVVDAEGRTVGPGGSGEIVLRGRGLMQGYWGRPLGEQMALRRDGFRTGDLARVDEDGGVVLLGRADEMLKVGGRKVNPLEIEMVLGGHPAVAEVAVCGRADPTGIFEQCLHAFVVPRDSATPTEAELLAHCRLHLEPYKLPAHVQFRTSLPKSPVGKLQRHALAAEPPTTASLST